MTTPAEALTASLTSAPSTGQGAAEPAQLPPGTLVSDRYRIEALLGEGGMGAVYRAEHVHMRKRVALKVLLPEWSRTPQVVARFEREAVAAGNIEHENIARATDFGRMPDGSFFLVLEYVEGRTLRTLLEEGPLDPSRAVRIAVRVCRAMAVAHAKGIVHRDLKPENIMLTTRGDDADFVKVLDFGIAKVDANDVGAGAGGAGLTQLGAIIGTPDYMAPEQALGRPIDARADLYALGIILYEMLAGERPFRGGAATVLRQHVLEEAPPLPPEALARIDARLAAIVRRLLQKAPQERHASASELLGELEGVLETVRDASSGNLAATPSARRVATSSAEGSLGSLGSLPTALATTPARSASLDVAPSPMRRALDALSPKARIGVVAGLALFVGVILTILVAAGGGDSGASPRAADLPPPPSRAELASGAARPTETKTAAPAAPAPPTASLASPSNAASEPASPPPPAHGKGRGKGGVRIPPPSQWFK